MTDKKRNNKSATREVSVAIAYFNQRYREKQNNSEIERNTNFYTFFFLFLQLIDQLRIDLKREI